MITHLYYYLIYFTLLLNYAASNFLIGSAKMPQPKNTAVYNCIEIQPKNVTFARIHHTKNIARLRRRDHRESSKPPTHKNTMGLLRTAFFLIIPSCSYCTAPAALVREGSATKAPPAAAHKKTNGPFNLTIRHLASIQFNSMITTKQL